MLTMERFHRVLTRGNLRRLTFILGMAVILVLVGCQNPPISSLDKAKRALEKASRAGALAHAKAQYDRAAQLLQDGRMEMARQNAKLKPFRNYAAADSLFALALLDAIKAESEAKTRIQELKLGAEKQQKELKTELSAWREALDDALTMFRGEHLWTRAKLSLDMSARFISLGEYAEALREHEQAKEHLRSLAGFVEEYSKDESQKIDVWREWVRETVSHSRKTGSTALIVDKSAHTLYLVRAGKVVKKYRCELGYNSARQKLLAGDGATPEGQYRITKVRPTGSKFYKALMINYPSDRDRRRFAENKQRNVISKYAHIGGLIEIHGGGGQNEDWTDGCVALANHDMDDLMQYVTSGTPVTIVRRSDSWP